jgi:hypothetical protein
LSLLHCSSADITAASNNIIAATVAAAAIEEFVL